MAVLTVSIEMDGIDCQEGSAVHLRYSTYHQFLDSVAIGLAIGEVLASVREHVAGGLNRQGIMDGIRNSEVFDNEDKHPKIN